MIDRSKALTSSILAYRRHSGKRGLISSLLRKYASLKHLFWSVCTSSDINKNADIQPDLKLPHPTGVVIHQDVSIGCGCMIMQQVTIGQLADGRVPRIGSNVYIGAGAKVLGGIEVGDNARIGANAVVLSNVPANCTAIGVPAVIRVRNGN